MLKRDQNRVFSANNHYITAFGSQPYPERLRIISFIHTEHLRVKGLVQDLWCWDLNSQPFDQQYNKCLIFIIQWQYLHANIVVNQLQIPNKVFIRDLNLAFGLQYAYVDITNFRNEKCECEPFESVISGQCQFCEFNNPHWVFTKS